MKHQIFRNDVLLVPGVRVANHFLQRLRGLLFTRTLAEDAGLLISPCRRVHTIGMQFSIDVVFLDQNNTVTSCIDNLVPVRMAYDARACKVLELAAGSAARLALAPGQRLCIGRPGAARHPPQSVAPGEQPLFGSADQEADGKPQH